MGKGTQQELSDVPQKLPLMISSAPDLVLGETKSASGEGKALLGMAACGTHGFSHCCTQMSHVACSILYPYQGYG